MHVTMKHLLDKANLINVLGEMEVLQVEHVNMFDFRPKIINEIYII